MKAIIKRQIKSYLKNPVFWMGIFVVFVGVYQLVSPYLTIHYVEENETMKAIIKRQIKSYLKNPVFWMGIFVVFVGVYQLVSPYLTIHYVEENE